MSDDELLRAALTRVEPPPGFHERVLRRATHTGSAWEFLRMAAIAILAIGLVGSFSLWTRREQNGKARRQTLWALQVTSKQLERTDTKLRRKSRPVYLFPISIPRTE